MSRKRRRRKKHPTSTPRAAATPPRESAETTPEPTEATGATDARSRRPQPAGEGRRGLFGRPATPSPFPPFGASLARGLRMVGSSPPILGASFLAAVATWGVFLALARAVPLAFLIAGMSASPLHIFFFDVDVIFRLGGTPTSALVGTVALGGVRAVTFGALLLLIAAALRADPERGASLRRADIRAALRPFPKVALSLFGVYVAEVAITIVVGFTVGLLQGNLRVVAALLAMHFLSFVPVVVALERTTAREGLRRGVRAARLPGGRHLGFVVAYVVGSLYILLLTPPPSLSPATPSVLAWALVLAVTFVHVGVTAALAYRWQAVRDHEAVVAPPRAAASKAEEPTARRGRG